MELFKKRYRQGLEVLAYYDRVTGLPNRDKFEEFFDSRPMNGRGYAYVVIRAEEYRRVREVLGRRPADDLLHGIADLLYESIIEGEAAARIGGGDFALMLKTESPEQLEERLSEIDRQLKQIRVLCTVEEKRMDFDYHVTYRVGALILSGVEQDAETVEGLARNVAQIAKAKGTGYAVLDQNNPSAGDTRAVAAYPDIGRAIAQQEFVSYIQPEYCFDTGRIVGGEMLVRWNHPSMGNLLPWEFLPLLEFDGRVFDVDMLMLQNACQMLCIWIKQKLMPVPFSINVSRLTFYRSDFVEKAKTIVSQYNVPPILISFELNESALFDAPELVGKVTNELRAQGFRVMLDNFGIGGFSSLHHIGFTNIHGVKIGWKFFRDGLITDREQTVLRSMIALSRELKASIVFTNVETIEQAELIKRMGGRYVQGFLFDKPFPQAAFEEMIFGPHAHEDLLRSLKVKVEPPQPPPEKPAESASAEQPAVPVPEGQPEAGTTEPEGRPELTGQEEQPESASAEPEEQAQEQPAAPEQQGVPASEPERRPESEQPTEAAVPQPEEGQTL